MSRLKSGILPFTALVLLLASLWLMTNATQGSARFDRLYSVLLVMNLAGLLTLAALIAHNLYRLLRQIRERQAGARLTGRMAAVFVALAVIPVIVVYVFSLQFLNKGIDTWFDVRIEQALDDALDLGRASLDSRMLDLLYRTRELGAELADTGDADIALRLEDQRLASGASELALLGPQGLVIAYSTVEHSTLVPDRPGDAALRQARQTGSYVDLAPVGDTGLHIRVVVLLSDVVAGEESRPLTELTDEPRFLQGLFPLAERLGRLADSVESAYGQYHELVYLRQPLKLSFILTLSLVLVLSLFAAVWVALFSARRIVAPLRDVALGTRAVAAGDYETRLPPAGKDEVGFLVASFNEMTRELARARDATRQSQRQLEEQRGYLEAVLERLSSGVLTLDQEGCLHTANQAAQQILGIALEEHVGRTLPEIASRHPHLFILADRLEPHLQGADGLSGDWREEVFLSRAGGRRILMCSGAGLSGAEEPPGGHVIVFDDLTELVEAQRKAAWSEVARRLAHEIKNPLTPIQLSAERLRKKYLDDMAPEEGQLLDRLTRTIVHQVESMKSMVNAFSDYARSPRARPQRLDLNALATDVVELYRDEGSHTRLATRLDPHLPALEADIDRIRQVLHNLVKNALEACTESADAHVEVETRRVERTDRCLAELRVTDSGPGFPVETIDRIFEPYTTSKQKGTGLGLAIVKKIVEEHNGRVWAENRREGGGSVVMQFPPPPSTRAGPGTSAGARREAVR